MEQRSENFSPIKMSISTNSHFNASATSSILPVVLCGGSGTRLWPLSRKSLPKQFVPLIDSKSLLSLTLERLKPLNEQMMLVGAEEHRFLLKDTLRELGCFGDLVLEPIPKNTAPAMAMAALLAKSTFGNDGLLLFCPADHHIPDVDGFIQSILAGVQEALNGSIVTYGVQPSFPSSAYGYIEKGGPLNQENIHLVARFIEKPTVQKAQNMLLTGKYLWNAGIFLTRCDTLLSALEIHAKEILDACTLAVERKGMELLTDKSRTLLPTNLDSESSQNQHNIRFIRPDKAALLNCPSNSIDFAVMEHHSNTSVVTFSGQWSDVGSWNAVADLTPRDQDENQIDGLGLAIESKNTFIYAHHRTVVALGVNDLLIVDTPDALMVANRSKAQDVKGLVEKLSALDNPTAVMHRRVARPWGWYDSVDQGERFQVKRIGVKVGASLSLQKHHHRAEHWIVVKGTAEVTNGDKVFLLHENESTFIQAGVVHRLHNPGQMDLEMIEVQSGSYLGEDDIVRLEDTYGRD